MLLKLLDKLLRRFGEDVTCHSTWTVEPIDDDHVRVIVDGKNGHHEITVTVFTREEMDRIERHNREQITRARAT
ncbi:MAG: hypothetical protein B7X04_02525 [Parcubacteria group bacterium 21-54-25]|nr:MAG: hypothetical protein B7X04_02525 [Parcubacteria group bacterium 21-54-25]HQU07768.1 hypothetical protein [Candidatus Paceibacterota bacterium]